jgi:glycosyltransferase involved in cell wall biosynthesis
MPGPNVRAVGDPVQYHPGQPGGIARAAEPTIERIAAVAGYGPQDPAFRVRLELPGRALAAGGLELLLLPLLSADQAQRFRTSGIAGKAEVVVRARRRLRRELRDLGDGARTVVVQRQVDIAPSLSLERAAVDARRLVYDVDDAVWLSGRQTMGHSMGFLKGARRKVRWLAERADHIIAGSEILAQYLGRYNEEVTVIPSLVDTTAYAVREHEHSASVTLGWIGSPTTAVYLHRLATVIERFAVQSPRPVRLRVVGGPAPCLTNVDVEQRAWSPRAERDALAEMDIGLMPLDDSPWSRGKCAYKALQYMASGIPALVDDVGVSASVVGDAGYAVASSAEWLEGLHALAADPSLRTLLGGAGRRRVEEDFSYDRWLPTLATILRGG